MVCKQRISIILLTLSYAAVGEDIASNTIQTSEGTALNKEPGLGNSIRDFAELNANLKQKYQAVDMATDISSMVRDMVGSLSTVQERGESMMKNILIQQKRLKALRAETKRAGDVLGNINSQITALEERRSLLFTEIGDLADRKEAADMELVNFNQHIQEQKLEKEKELKRMAKEMKEYETRLGEATNILSGIEQSSEQKREELQRLTELKDTQEQELKERTEVAELHTEAANPEQKTVTVDMLVPAFLVSVVANLVMGGQMLNIFKLDELADVAALSFGDRAGDRADDDDPIIQLAELKRKKEKKFGKKNIANNFIDRRKLYLNREDMELYPLL